MADGPSTNNILFLLASISKIRCFSFRLFVARITQNKLWVISASMIRPSKVLLKQNKTGLKRGKCSHHQNLQFGLYYLEIMFSYHNDPKNMNP